MEALGRFTCAVKTLAVGPEWVYIYVEWDAGFSLFFLILLCSYIPFSRFNSLIFSHFCKAESVDHFVKKKNNLKHQ